MTPTYNLPNLILLRDWLAANREQVEQHLDMRNFYSPDGLFGVPLEYLPDPQDITQACGTSLCMVGFAAISQVPALTPNDDTDNGWYDYAYRVFFNNRPQWDEEAQNGFRFLFGVNHPNNVDLALERLNYVIEHRAIPEDWQVDPRWDWWGEED